jgi:hypothetical protein
MFNKVAKLFLIGTAFSPALFTLAFLEYMRGTNRLYVVSYLIVAVLLAFICWSLLRTANRQLEVLPFQVLSMKTADNEILAFVIAYLLPLIGISGAIQTSVLLFVLGLILVIIWTTHAYHCNPILGLMGYHFYEIVTDGNVTFILVTRKTLRQCKEVKRVVQLTDYIVLDSKDR